MSVAHNDVTAECGTTPEQPFAPLVDSAAALAAHERMPAGRVINKQNAAVEDAQAREEWLAERRRESVEYRARVAARLRALQEEAKRDRWRRAQQAKRARDAQGAAA